MTVTTAGEGGVAEKQGQVWRLQVGPRVHEVISREATVTKREVLWLVDGELVATKTTSEEKVVLTPEEEEGAHLGAIRVIHTAFNAPRRAIWFEGQGASAQALTGLGGVDMEPEAGSPVAVREERMARRPGLYAARHVAGGVMKVVGPVIVAWLIARSAGLLPGLDLNLPRIPLPDIDLPDLPWLDINLPSIPWPDWNAPGWLVWIVGHAKYVVPILIGIALARSEIRRRQTTAQRREELRSRDLDPESKERDAP